MPLRIPVVVPKRFWVPTHRNFDTRGGYQVGPYVLHYGDRASIFFRLPPDYTSMTSINVFMRPWSDRASWPLEIKARAAGVGENWILDAHSETQTITVATVDDEILSIDLVTILTTMIPQLKAEDIFEVTIESKMTVTWITCFGADVRYS